MARVMVLGSGGREHTIYKWFRQYGHEAFCAPGNGGSDGNNIAVDDICDAGQLIEAAGNNSIDLIVVGPEAPLVADVVPKCRDAGVRIFGPPAEAAILEGSKIEARRFATKYGARVPDYTVFEAADFNDNVQNATDFLLMTTRGLRPLPFVVKADGLCGGKGVYVADDFVGILDGIVSLKGHGRAGEKFLLEERIRGEEASITIITDGRSYKMLPASTDYKRAFDNDKGPNTGGMGAYAPSVLVTPELENAIRSDIIDPTLKGIQEEGWDYHGVIYFAIMVQDNKPYLIEYNCRLGDPETQVILPLVDADPYRLIIDCLDGKIDESPFGIKPGCACCVVVADTKYPASKIKGERIVIPDSLAVMDSVTVYHAGTEMQDGWLISKGGRLLGVTGFGESHKDANDRAFGAAKAIMESNPDLRARCRMDIGHQAYSR
jgi:phosphoribosylamine--glycine ligase